MFNGIINLINIDYIESDNLNSYLILMVGE